MLRLALVVAYYLLSPVLLALLVRRRIDRLLRRGVRRPTPGRVRRAGRWFLLPWLLYAVNVVAVGPFLDADVPSAWGESAGPALTGALLLAVGFLPALVLARIIRCWARSIGPPAGTVSVRVEVRAWIAHVLVLAGCLLAALGTFAASESLVLTVAVAGVVLGGYLYAYPHIFVWVWKAEPLRDAALDERVRHLAVRHGVSVRKVWVIPRSRMGAPNAFASGILGRNRCLFVTERLLECLAGDEIEAVLAHEIGHLRYGHMARVAGAAAATGVVAGIVLFMMFRLVEASGMSAGQRTPLFALFGMAAAALILLVSRTLLRRFEYEADAFAVRALGTPEPFVRALREIARENWLPYGSRGRGGFFASHPTIRQRIRRMIAAEAADPSSR